MKQILILLLTVLSIHFSFAQKYITKTGHISFFSSTPIEDIEANNYQTTSIIDLETGKVVFSLLMKSFEFEKALMQEHFNEKYVESDEFPKSKFTGQIDNFDHTKFAKNGNYSVDVSGNLTIHGVTKNIKTKGTIIKTDDKIEVKSNFVVSVEEYNIKIPSLVKENIANEIEIEVKMEYKSF